MKNCVAGWLCVGLWAKFTVGSVLEEICLHGDTSVVTEHGQIVTPLHISFGDDSAMLHQHQEYPFSIDQEYSELLIRTSTGMGNVDVQVESTEGLVECRGSAGQQTRLMRGKTNRVVSVQFMKTGDVNVDVIAVLENGQTAMGSFVSHIHGPTGEEFIQEAMKDTKLHSALDDGARARAESGSVKARDLSSTYSSFINRFGSSPVFTPEPTQVPVPMPTVQTFAPTISLKPTSTVAPTYSEKCDYGITCEVDDAANVEFAGFLFPCRSLIEFSKIGLVAPDVCEASKAAVRESCSCRQTNVRSASRDKSKRVVLLTSSPTSAPTKEEDLAFSNPVCDVCHVDKELPLIISGVDFKCSDLSYYGSMGFFPPELCPVAQRQAKEHCGCVSTKRSSERTPYNAAAAAASPDHETNQASLPASSSTRRQFTLSSAKWIVGTAVALIPLL